VPNQLGASDHPRQGPGFFENLASHPPARSFGGGGEEMDAWRQYEQALQDGHLNVLVLAPTEERKRLAADILRQHGGHFINFFGRLAIEKLA
jgi:hypothetical protein